MLSEAERDRIRAEEEVRWKTNRELSEEFTKIHGNRVWSFLNSAFGLWVLSTLAVGGLTTVYTHIHRRVVEQQAREERIEKLDLEIEGRLSQFLVNIERMVAKPYDDRFSLSKRFTSSDIQQCWRELKIPPSREPKPDSMTAVFPENADRGLVSLVVELSRLVDEDHSERTQNTLVNKKGKKVKELMTTIEGDEIRQVAVNIVDDSIFEGQQTSDFLPIWERFQKDVLLRRWTLSFPYVDCEKPFC